MAGGDWPDGHKNASGAWWCREHVRWECTADSRRTETRCHGSAVKYTDRCRTHAGMSTEKASNRGYARLTAWSAEGIRAAQSNAPPVTPGEAVLGMLSISYMRAHYYAGLLEAQVEEQGGRPGEDRAVEGPLDWLERDFQAGEDGSPEDEVRSSLPESSGLVGHKYSATNSGTFYATGEELRALVVLEAQERDRCVKYAKVAHDMGIAERQIQLAEKQGEAMVGMVKRILNALQLTPEQQQLVSVVVPQEFRRLKEIEPGANVA